MLTLYWIPTGTETLPRVMVFENSGRKYQAVAVNVPEVKGCFRYKFPDNEKNRLRYDVAVAPWHKELPTKVKKEEVSAKKKHSFGSSIDDPRVSLTRTELITVLENNGIAFRRNQKTTTLFEKLPDDIARNFKLAESGVEVQA